MKKLFFTLLVFTFLSDFLNAQPGGTALKFDGATDYVEIAHNNSLNVSKYTVELWFYWDNPSTTSDVQFLIAKSFEQLEIHTGGGGGNKGLRFIPTSGVYFDTGANAFEPNTWNHVAFSYDPSNSYYKCYINGVERTLTNSVGSPNTPVITSTSPLVLGKRSNSSMYFKGKIDEVRLWNSIRTEAEIRANMYKEISAQANLIACYKMNEGSGTALADDSGNGISGTIQGAEWKVSGALAGARKALNFNGSNQYVEIAHSDQLNVSQYTAEMWFYWDNPASTDAVQFLMGKGVGQLEIHTGGDAVSKRLRFLPAIGVYFDTEPNAFEINTWNHVAFVCNPTASYYKCYINGVEKKLTQTGTLTTLSNTTTPLRLGLRGDSYGYFKGKIDEFRLWNYARSADEVASTAFVNADPASPGLVAYYRMDQEKGNTLYDQTSHANHGTLKNMSDADRVTSTAFNSWLGTESNIWNDAINWSAGAVPSSTDNIGIYKWSLGNELSVTSDVSTGSMMVSGSSNPTVGAAINTSKSFVALKNLELKPATANSFGSLMVNNGNLLIVPADATITVNSNLYNSGKLLLKSDENNSAQFKNAGTTSLAGTVVLRKTLKAASGWYFVSFPFDIPLSNIKITATQESATIGNYRTAKVPYENLFIIEYNGLRRDQTGTTAATNSPNWDAVTSGTLTANKGYGIRVMSDTELDFIGTANAGMFGSSDVSVSVGNYTSNSNAIHRGWNLVGIPYSTAFDIDNLSEGQYFYLYDQATKTYLVKEKSKDTYQFSPFSSFFMQAASASLTFGKSGSAFKVPFTSSKTEYVSIDLSLTNNLYTDRTEIRLMEGASEAYEINSDAAKFMSMDNAVPQVWSKAQTFDVAINALPETTSEVELGVRLGSPGNYTLQLNRDLQAFRVVLVDSHTNSSTELTSEKTYEFSSTQSGTFNDRFKIVLQPNLTTGLTDTADETVKVKANGRSFAVNGIEGTACVRITDLTGKTIAGFNNLSNNEICSFNYKGAAIFSITDRNTTRVIKVVF